MNLGAGLAEHVTRHRPSATVGWSLVVLVAVIAASLATCLRPDPQPATCHAERNTRP